MSSKSSPKCGTRYVKPSVRQASIPVQRHVHGQRTSIHVLENEEPAPVARDGILAENWVYAYLDRE